MDEECDRKWGRRLAEHWPTKLLQRHCETRWTIIENCILGQATDYPFFQHPQFVLCTNLAELLWLALLLVPVSWTVVVVGILETFQIEEIPVGWKLPFEYRSELLFFKSHSYPHLHQQQQCKEKTTHKGPSCWTSPPRMSVPGLNIFGVVLVNVVNFYCYSEGGERKLKGTFNEYVEDQAGFRIDWDAHFPTPCIDHQKIDGYFLGLGYYLWGWWHK